VTEYSEAFKVNMVKKMMLPGGPTASALSIRSGICQPTLSRWLRDRGPPTAAMAARRFDWFQWSLVGVIALCGAAILFVLAARR
jgi:hypothetical protein